MVVFEKERIEKRKALIKKEEVPPEKD